MSKKTRDFRLYLEEILEAIDKAKRFTKDFTSEMFANNELVIEAVLRQFSIIGEAANCIPEEIREKYPDIPWRGMIGLRNLVIHEYFAIDLAQIWKILTSNLPSTQMMIESMLQDFLSQDINKLGRIKRLGEREKKSL